MLTEWLSLVTAGLIDQVRPEIHYFWQVAIPVYRGYIAEDMVQAFIILNPAEEGFRK